MARVYIAGPMRGYPQFNFPAFDAARDAWAARGWEVVSPADMDRTLDGVQENNPTPDQIHSFAHYMRRDISALLTVDAIAFLPGWEASTGANVEKVVAQALNLDQYDAITFAALAPAEERNGKHSMFPVLEAKLEACAEVPAHHTI
jgi:hypothetical protein